MTDPTPVDAARLAYGNYDHEKERDVDEGDICGSYSGDTIAESGRVRRPFKMDGFLWTCVGTGGCGGIQSADAYKLIPLKMFIGTPTTYREKTGTMDGAEAARNDPLGFYHSMVVHWGKDQFVLTGPERTFVADPTRPAAELESQQMSLFT